MKTGRVTDSSRKCTGVGREVPMSRKLHPATLYHVTTSKTKVCREGLKTNKELWKEEKRGHVGVGGANDDFISFTYDESLAQDYAKDMITLARIANGTVTPSNIDDYLDKHDASIGMNAKPSEVFERLNHDVRGLSAFSFSLYDGIIDDLKNGIFLDKKNMYYHLGKLSRDDCIKFIKEQIPSNSFLDAEKMCSNIEDLKKNDIPQLEELSKNFMLQFKKNFPDDYRKINSKERQKILFEIVHRFYFHDRRDAGGRQNPLFFAVSIEDYEKIHPDEVGIFKVLAFLPRSLDTYLNSHEFKTFGDFEEEYPVEDLEKIRRGDKILISYSEKEVRIHPKYTTMLEEMPMRR